MGRLKTQRTRQLQSVTNHSSPPHAWPLDTQMSHALPLSPVPVCIGVTCRNVKVHTRWALPGIFPLQLYLPDWSLSGCDIRHGVQHLAVPLPPPIPPWVPAVCLLPSCYAQPSAEDEGQRCKRRAGAPRTQLRLTRGQMDHFISQNSLPRALPYGAIKKGLDPRFFRGDFMSVSIY